MKNQKPTLAAQVITHLKYLGYVELIEKNIARFIKEEGLDSSPVSQISARILSEFKVPKPNEL